jgi:tRNA (mo5U34)-methyltransferase
MAALDERLHPGAHGDLPRWLAALDELEQASDDTERTEAALMALRPWRKGPFEIRGITVDAEWRSNLKWDRIRAAVGSLEGQCVLDVGSGNGYYGFEMRKLGAASVIGIDPTILFLAQFAAVQQCRQDRRIAILPLRLEDLPLPARVFDTTFSMGVLYHRRSPLDHLRELRQTLKPGGRLVLETLYLPGDGAFARTPPDRYARMRNVWLLPAVDELLTWLRRTGFRDVSIADRSVTSTEEQRATDWMEFESLEAALDPSDPDLTIEGWPRPHRVVLTASTN